jgi:hypothetical protein
MALPTSGQLTFEQIGTELGISTAGPHDLRSMSSTAGKTIPDNITDFYGYSHATAPTSAPTSINGGQQIAGECPVTVSITWGAVSGATSYRIEYRKGTAAWTFLANDTASPYVGGSISAVQGDSLDFRVRGYNAAGDGPWGYDYNGSNVICFGNEK